MQNAKTSTNDMKSPSQAAKDIEDGQRVDTNEGKQKDEYKVKDTSDRINVRPYQKYPWFYI